jgi:hypothetical protein
MMHHDMIRCCCVGSRTIASSTGLSVESSIDGTYTRGSKVDREDTKGGVNVVDFIEK